MASLKDTARWVIVTHNELTFSFKKLGNDIAHYQFARLSIGGPNADRTSRYDLPEYRSSGEEPIPDEVLEAVRDAGYTLD